MMSLPCCHILDLLNILNSSLCFFQDKLKGSYPLATIASVTSADDSGSTIKITFPETVPVYLQAGDTFNCQEWINAIQEGIY